VPLPRDLAGDVLADIMRVTAAASAGPWRLAGPGYGAHLGGKQHVSVYSLRGNEEPLFIALTGLLGEAQSEADAAFIASAREAVPWLVDEVNRLRAARMRGWDTALDSAQHAEQLQAQIDAQRDTIAKLTAEVQKLRALQPTSRSRATGVVVNLGIGRRASAGE
jgi:hypothetical protein